MGQYAAGRPRHSATLHCQVLLNPATSPAHTLYAIALGEFSHSRTGTFNCRAKTIATPKQLNKLAFPARDPDDKLTTDKDNIQQLYCFFGLLLDFWNIFLIKGGIFLVIMEKSTTFVKRLIMAKELMTLDEFEDSPDWLRDGIEQAIEEGFQTWQKIREFAATVTPEPLNYDNTTHCNAIQDHIQGRLKTIFQSQPDVRVDKFENDVLGLLYKNTLFVRFNKLTEDFRTRTKLTDSHKKYLSQDPDIPGLPPRATIVFAGYLADKTMSIIKSINVVCWTSDGLEWLYDYSFASTLQTSLHLVTMIPTSPTKEIGITSEPRIGKKRTKRKTGDTDNQ